MRMPMINLFSEVFDSSKIYKSGGGNDDRRTESFIQRNEGDGKFNDWKSSGGIKELAAAQR